MSERNRRPVRLTPAQLFKLKVKDGFRIEFPAGGYYYFLLTYSDNILVKEYKYDDNGSHCRFVTVEASLASRCIPVFFNVVVPYIRKLGWIPNGR